MTPDGVWGLVVRHADRVRHVGPVRKELDFASGCEAPRTLTLVGRPWLPYRATDWAAGHQLVNKVHRDRFVSSVELKMFVRCRHCDMCRKWRAAMWADRAMVEAEASTRVWMACLEFKPDTAFMLKARAQVRELRRGNVWDTLSADEQFRALQRQSGMLLTMWLKRLRKAGHKVRYLIACEAHKSGVPHYHAIIHELGEPIRKTCTECRKKSATGQPWRTGQGCCLEASWPHGFTKFELVPRDQQRRAVRYVTKYAAKNVAARLRPSVRYGVGGDLKDAVGAQQPRIDASFAAYDKQRQTQVGKGAYHNNQNSDVGAHEMRAVPPGNALYGAPQGAECMQGRGAPGGEPCKGSRHQPIPAWWIARGRTDVPGRLGVAFEKRASESWEEAMMVDWLDLGTGPPKDESEVGRAAKSSARAIWDKPWTDRFRRN